jgi:hypothetical protein
MLGFRCSRLLLLAGLVMGCDPFEADASLSTEVAELSDRHACADLIVVAASADAREGLFLTVDDGLVDEVIESGEPVDARYEVGDERIELRWVTGSNVYAGHCGLDNGEPWHVDEVEQAITGEVTIELVPSDEGVIVAVELRDVWLSPLDAGQAKHGHARELPPIVLDDLRVRR